MFSPASGIAHQHAGFQARGDGVRWSRTGLIVDPDFKEILVNAAVTSNIFRAVATQKVLVARINDRCYPRSARARTPRQSLWQYSGIRRERRGCLLLVQASTQRRLVLPRSAGRGAAWAAPRSIPGQGFVAAGRHRFAQTLAEAASGNPTGRGGSPWRRCPVAGFADSWRYLVSLTGLAVKLQLRLRQQPHASHSPVATGLTPHAGIGSGLGALYRPGRPDHRETFGPLAEVLADVLSRFVPEQRDLLHTSFALAEANRLEHMFASGDEFTASLRGLRDRACAPGSAVPSRPGGSIRS